MGGKLTTAIFPPAPQVTADGIVVEFDLLDRQPTDPPNVRSLMETITFMKETIAKNQLTVRL